MSSSSSEDGEVAFWKREHDKKCSEIFQQAQQSDDCFGAALTIFKRLDDAREKRLRESHAEVAQLKNVMSFQAATIAIMRKKRARKAE